MELFWVCIIWIITINTAGVELNAATQEQSLRLYVSNVMFYAAPKTNENLVMVSYSRRVIEIKSIFIKKSFTCSSWNNFQDADESLSSSVDLFELLCNWNMEPHSWQKGIHICLNLLDAFAMSWENACLLKNLQENSFHSRMKGLFTIHTTTRVISSCALAFPQSLRWKGYISI